MLPSVKYEDFTLIYVVFVQVLLTEPPMNPMKNREKMIEASIAMYNGACERVYVCE